jgi:hypothetical protein
MTEGEPTLALSVCALIARRRSPGSAPMCRPRRPRSVHSSKPRFQMIPIDVQKLPGTNERVLEVLLAEIRRYLDAVDVFRAEGREPRWA